MPSDPAGTATVAPRAPGSSAHSRDPIVPPGWMGNLHPSLRHCWHPVGRPGDLAGGATTALQGDPWHVGAAGDRWWAEGPDGAAWGVTEHLGLVWVAPCEPLPPLPDLPEAADPAFTAVPAPPWDWATSAAQMADGACDITHVPFLHRATIGDPSDAVLPPYPVSVDTDGWRVSGRYSHRCRALDTRPVRVQRHVTIEYTAPFSVRLRLEHPEEGVVLTSAFFHQPLAERRTRLWCTNLRTDIADGRCRAEDATALHRAVNDEDRRLLERSVYAALPLDLRAEVHVRSDRITVELRRSLARLVARAGTPR